jgi:hypothetical protein
VPALSPLVLPQRAAGAARRRPRRRAGGRSRGCPSARGAAGQGGAVSSRVPGHDGEQDLQRGGPLLGDDTVTHEPELGGTGDLFDGGDPLSLNEPVHTWPVTE